MQDHKYFILTLSFLVSGLFMTLHADAFHKKSVLRKSSSGVEVRANFVGSSGRFVQDFTERDSSGNVVDTYSKTADLTSKGLSLQVGYARDYVRRDQYSFLYIGYEAQKWNDAYESDFHAFIIGAEGGIGSRTLKFIYGGEFGFGALDTGSDGLGYLGTFSAEPYVGLKVLLGEAFSLNFRMGARGFYIEEVVHANGANEVTSQNGAYTANGQIGLGYRFY